MRLPLEKLRDEYIPIKEVPLKYNISIPKIMRLINNHKINYAEFKAPGETRRTIHVHPAEILKLLGEEESK